jgi:hypothetical protein
MAIKHEYSSWSGRSFTSELIILFATPIAESCFEVCTESSILCVSINTFFFHVDMYFFPISEKITVFPPPVGS